MNIKNKLNLLTILDDFEIKQNEYDKDIYEIKFKNYNYDSDYKPLSADIDIKTKYVKVSVDRLVKLLNAEKELLALKRDGVDNWERYEESLPDNYEYWKEEDVLAIYKEVK